MYDYSPETCLIKDVDGQLYNIIDLWRGIKQPVDPSTIKKAYAPRTCLVENIDGTTVNIIDTILTVANGSGAGTSCLQEVIQARNEYKTLDERLDTENMKIYETLNSKDYLPFEGEYITVPHSKVGYTKGLKIQGKTYQNLAIFPKSFTLNQSKRIYSYPITLKANTDYTIIVNIKKYTQGTDTINLGVFFFCTDNKSSIYDNLTNSTAPGVKMKKFSFPVSKDKIGIYIQQTQADGGAEVEIGDIMVLEGDYTTPGKYIPPYFEGIKSVGEEENNKIDILSNGKNFVDNSKNKLCDLNYSTGVEEFNVRNCIVTDFINISNLKEFVYESWSTNSKAQVTTVRWYDKNKKYLGRDSRPSNAHYIRLRKMSGENYNNINEVWFQLEKGAQKTSYEPYQSYNKETLLPYNYGLKGLSDTVCDEIVDNKVIQRVGRVVLNGSEKWTAVETDGIFAKYFLSFYPNNILTGNLQHFTCDKFITSRDVQGNTNRYEFISTVDKHYSVILQIKTSRLSENTANGLKKYLQANPVTVYYALAEPVTHNLPIDNREMKTYDGITHISSINAINPYLDCQAPSNPQAVVADLMVANENLSNELDVKTKELQAKDEHLMNENDLLTAKDLDMDFRIFELEEQLTPEVAKLSLSHNSPYLMIERCIERGLYEKEDMLYKMGRYLHGKRLTQEEYDKLKLMMG